LHQGLRTSRLWLALVLVLFCGPLFSGLRNLDLETDEAIYSFAVDDILADGEWLQPKSSPSDTDVFLEKPPLKFWIVAAPIRLGLLPHDEFGLRFWDAVFGSVSFLYVFLLGTLLAGPVCGAVAGLILFVHAPLVFEHGLRTNNMEAALALSYCGGMFHYLRWAAGSKWAGGHALAAGLYFVLGFMTKFVAVAFLPAVLFAATILFRQTRQRLQHEWKRWAAVAALTAALIAPWFVYASVKFGGLFWETILAEHVYARFTTSLNPEHVQPWNFYVVTAWRQFADARLAWLVGAGLALLTVQTIRRRWFEGAVVVLWAVLPIALISLGSSKLYHYVYPFLPPLALAGGYGIALFLMLAPVQLRKAGERVEDALARVVPAIRAWTERSVVRRTVAVLVWGGLLIAAFTVVTGGVRVNLGRDVVFRSSGLLRPALAAALLAMVARRSAFFALPFAALLVIAVLPFSAYADNIRRLHVERHPMRDASVCVARVQAENPSLPRGMFVDTDQGIWHPITYYFRRIHPWIRQERPSPESLERTLEDPQSLRPSLVEDERYRDYRSGPDAVRFSTPTSPPMIGLNGYALLLPGPYSVCSPEARLLAER
jgi:4-amino-4-deoxy-L-arabinose transferase-like glycosyltransferase